MNLKLYSAIGFISGFIGCYGIFNGIRLLIFEHTDMIQIGLSIIAIIIGIVLIFQSKMIYDDLKTHK
jgi:DMSO reductase anchor subunit